MRIQYVGVFADDGVELHEREGAIWFPGNQAVDVPDELGQRLLDQPVNFVTADDVPAKSARKSTDGATEVTR